MVSDSDSTGRCQALTRAGRACRAWAQKGSRERYGRPLCYVHAQSEGAGTDLQPAGDAAPTEAELRLHDHPWRALYGDAFFPAELAALDILADSAEGLSPTAEIEAARVLLRRLLAFMATAPPAESARLAPSALDAMRTIGRLMRDKQALAAGKEDQWQVAIFEVLDELGEEWGIEL